MDLCVVVLCRCLFVCLFSVSVWSCCFTVSCHVDSFCFCWGVCVVCVVCACFVSRCVLAFYVVTTLMFCVLVCRCLCVIFCLLVCVCCCCGVRAFLVATLLFCASNGVLFVWLYSCVAVVRVSVVCVCFWFGCCRCVSCVVVRDVCYRLSLFVCRCFALKLHCCFVCCYVAGCV